MKPAEKPRKIQIRRDQHFKKRGGFAKVYRIICGDCGQPVLIYQKDGVGHLFRCYLNRIHWPDVVANLSQDRCLGVETLPPLICLNCENVIGIPMRHHDGRLAFKLRQGNFRKVLYKEETLPSQP